MKKALIAMSGGVDSSVAAYLMQQRGWDCIGVTMRLFRNEDAGISRSRSCCSLDDVEDARSVAYRLGMPYYVFNFTDDFRAQVMQRFVCAYENGRTPNPCIDCNRYLKFDRLYHRAGELGCDCVVTGHYARIEEREGRYFLQRAADPSKDQSYVLYDLTQEQLAHTRFPLGELSKTETRKIAQEQGFFNAEKPDSQDICFVPDGDYAAFIRRFTGKEYPPGEIVDETGRVLGRHHGIVGYTVGQRRGLGLAAGTPVYVKEILPEENRIVVSGPEGLLCSELETEQFHCIVPEAYPRELRAQVKVRYRQPAQSATVYLLDNGCARIVFDAPQRAITRGQAAVVYDGDIVVGGGRIV